MSEINELDDEPDADALHNVAAHKQLVSIRSTSLDPGNADRSTVQLPIVMLESVLF